MSCSKPLPPFTYDVLRYLNRDQLERFLIVCHPLKNLIDRYFSSKPYRIFDQLAIRSIGLYALFHNNVQWHPNRQDYSVQQFLAGQKCSIDELKGYYDDMSNVTSYLFAEMRLYLGSTVRIKQAVIYVGEDSTCNPEQIEQMESIAYLWREGNICIANTDCVGIVLSEDFQPILHSPIILQCQRLAMINARFSFNDYNVLYTVKVIETWSGNPTLWQPFLETPGVKPVISLFYSHENIDSLLNQLSKAFSSAVSLNAYKIVFVQLKEPLIEFQKTNNTSREKLELKKGFPTEYQNKYSKKYHNYTLERSSI